MAGPELNQITTGTLRRDIEIIPPGRHGSYPMIFDPASETYYKLSIPTWRMLLKYSEDIPLPEFARRLTRSGIPADMQEIMMLKQFLHQSNLLTPDPGTFSEQMANVKKSKGKHLWLKVASMYLYFKLPPIHPQPVIDKIKPYIGFIGSKYFVWGLIIPAVIGYILALRDLSGIMAMLEASFSWAGLVKYFFAIIVLKIIHESGHLAANMRYNCRVRAIGISVIFLYPRFYSDTTDSWRLPRRQRLLIDAGGLLSEMICGGLAAFAWCYLPPGNLQSTMFFIFAVSTASTILVNGNPLIRFDGYYILCDLLNVENLMQRSGEYIKQLNRHLLFGLGGMPSDDRPVLMTVFGISAFIYRFLLYTSIILVIYNSMIKTVAIVLLILEVLTIFILPCYNEMKIVRAMSRRAGRRANMTFVSVIVLALLFVLFFPLSWRSVLPGESCSRFSLLVTAAEHGFLKSDPPSGPLRVKKDQVILTLESPHLDLEIERRKAVLKEEMILLDQQSGDSSTAGDAQLTRKRVENERAVISELIQRRKRLVIKAAADGVFVPGYSELSSGAAIPTGTVFGVLNSSGSTVNAYSRDNQLARLSPGMKVAIRFKDHPGDAEGVIERIDPVPVTFTASPLLASSGGEINAGPVSGKKGEFIAEHPMFRVEIRPEKDFRFQHGRTLRVLVENREILFDKIISYCLYFFRQEF